MINPSYDAIGFAYSGFLLVCIVGIFEHRTFL